MKAYLSTYRRKIFTICNPLNILLIGPMHLLSMPNVNLNTLWFNVLMGLVTHGFNTAFTLL